MTNPKLSHLQAQLIESNENLKLAQAELRKLQDELRTRSSDSHSSPQPYTPPDDQRALVDQLRTYLETKGIVDLVVSQNEEINRLRAEMGVKSMDKRES